MSQNLTTIGFDADDTLWQNEQFFRLTQERLAELLQDYVEGEDLYQRLLEAEHRNLGHYGFGIKGFTLSMIETAIDVSEARVPSSVIAEIIAAGQDMLRHPIELLPHAREAVEEISASHKVLLITKGDLLHQEQKLAQSGLGELFDGVEIVSNKNAGVYRDIFTRHGDGADRAMMVGNSMRSDVRPAIEAGGWGVFVPHDLTWELEHEAPPDQQDRYHEITDLAGLADVVAEIG
jgi:putative hydrolase of the HAD superfamily